MEGRIRVLGYRPMSRPHIKIVAHLDYAELTQRFETCDHPTMKNYWLVLQLLSHPEAPMSAEQVAKQVGCSVDWIRKLAGRYNRLGPGVIVNSRSSKTKRKANW